MGLRDEARNVFVEGVVGRLTIITERKINEDAINGRYKKRPMGPAASIQILKLLIIGLISLAIILALSKHDGTVTLNSSVYL